MTTLHSNQASLDERALVDYAAYLRTSRLDEVARENLRLVREMDAPLLRLFAHLPENELLRQASEGMQRFLADLEAGTALQSAARALALWQADELPGISKESIRPGDLVLVYAAQKGALLAFVTDYTTDVQRALAIVRALESYYRQVQLEAFHFFARMREDAARRSEQTARETEAQAAELARQKDLLERLIEQAPAGIAFLDRNLVVRRVNPAFSTLLDRPAEFFLGRQLFELATAESRSMYEASVRAVVATGEPYQASGLPYSIALDGGPRDTFWDIAYVPVFGVGHEVEGVLVFATEVSARVERERLNEARIEQMQQLDRLKDEFLNAMSYQLGTPIHTVMGFAGVLADGAMGTLRPEQLQYLLRILATCRVQMALVDDLLDMTRMSAGKFALHCQRFPLREMLTDVLDGLQALVEQKGQRLIRHLPADLPRLWADRNRLEQALTNLLNGAIKITPPGGLIRFQVERSGNELRIEVQDSGAALSAEDRAQVFERFTQHEGNWLGLAVTRSLVEAHHGHIGVKSAPGEGNTFWLTVPVDPPEQGV